MMKKLDLYFTMAICRHEWRKAIVTHKTTESWESVERRIRKVIDQKYSE